MAQVALTGGKTQLAKTLALVFILTNVYFALCLLPMNGLMQEHWTNKKNNPAMVNKGDVTPFAAMMVVESVCRRPRTWCTPTPCTFH